MDNTKKLRRVSMFMINPVIARMDELRKEFDLDQLNTYGSGDIEKVAEIMTILKAEFELVDGELTEIIEESIVTL